MCDYCDCRSHAVIAELSGEHDVLLGDLHALTVAVADDDEPGAHEIARRLGALLDTHATREERGVLAELDAAGAGDAYVGAFRHDHGRVHALVADIRSPRWRDAARELVRALTDHIAREESDLFPAAHQLLTPAQWDEIDRAASAARGPG